MATQLAPTAYPSLYSPYSISIIETSTTKPRILMAANAVVKHEISRADFPDDFIFGASSSAFQVEGAVAEDGRAASMWDVFSLQKPSNIADGSNANVAVDQYHRYKEDVSIMKKMGLDSYRFSISWPRVLPGGRLSAGVNEKGIQYYNNLIDELLANGIEPLVTLFHWDVPQALEAEYGGFLCRKIVDDYREFVDLCFWEFGDRVKKWSTLNEPQVFASVGYAGGGLAPGRGFVGSEVGDPGTEPYTVGHNLLLAHCEAVKLYRENYKSQGGKIGISLSTGWWEPYTNTLQDREASERMFDFNIGWYLSPVTYGDYPERMKKIVKSRLKEFSEEESRNLKGSYDFIGVNYYSGDYAKDTSHEPNCTDHVFSYNTDSMVNAVAQGPDGSDIGPQVGSKWMYKLLKYIKLHYNDPIIYITENGYSEANDPKLTVSEARKDEKRVQYIHYHLKALKQAMDEKVKVRGYFVWSFTDTFEWKSGYTVRLGLIYVDYKDSYARYPKLSALWYMNFINKAQQIEIPHQTPSKRPLPETEPSDEKAPKRKVIYKV